MHWRYSPTASPYSSNMVAACCCYALRSTQLSNILASLMLRSKICASFFQASTIIECYALRSSLQSPNIIDATDLQFFYYHWRYAQRFSLQVSNISDSTLKDLLLYFPWFSNIVDATLSDLLFTFQSSSMLHSKIFFWLFSHSTRIDAMFFDFLFVFLPLYHHWCYSLRTALQFSIMFDVTRYSLQTYLKLRSKIFSSSLKHQWCSAPRSSIFQHHWRDALRSSVPFSDIISAAL